MTTQKSDGPIFGTDGIRGRALEGWLSPTAVEALGRAAGAVLSRDSDGSEGAALIAHDGRRGVDTLVVDRGVTASIVLHKLGGFHSHCDRSLFGPLSQSFGPSGNPFCISFVFTQLIALYL